MNILGIYLLGVIMDFILILCLKYFQLKNGDLDVLEKRIAFRREMKSNTPLCLFSWIGLIIVVGTARDAFSTLIDKVNSKGTWESNPFVWVYDFELVK